MNLSQVDLNLLVALNALLRERNVTRSGERLGLSQPAMSSALARLRRLFQDDLLVREGREYQLTSLAQELIEPLDKILRLIDETIEKRPEFNPAVDEHIFTVMASDHMSFLVMQPLFQRFQDAAPRVTLQIQPLVSPMDTAKLADVDVVIGYEDMVATMPSKVLFRDRWVCAVWSGNEEVGEYLTLDQYLKLPHLGFGMSVAQLSGLADRAASALHPSRQVRVTVETFFLLPFLLQGTRLVTFVHERLGRRLAALSEIRLVEPPFEVSAMAETMFWHPRSSADPAQRWLREEIAASAASV